MMIADKRLNCQVTDAPQFKLICPELCVRDSKQLLLGFELQTAMLLHDLGRSTLRLVTLTLGLPRV